jgi:hypothetical protein
MTLQNTNVLDVVPSKEFSAREITDVTPVNGRTKVKLSPFGAGDFVFVCTLENAGGAFLEAF